MAITRKRKRDHTGTVNYLYIYTGVKTANIFGHAQQYVLSNNREIVKDAYKLIV